MTQIYILTVQRYANNLSQSPFKIRPKAAIAFSSDCPCVSSNVSIIMQIILAASPLKDQNHARLTSKKKETARSPVWLKWKQKMSKTNQTLVGDTVL